MNPLVDRNFDELSISLNSIKLLERIPMDCLIDLTDFE